MSTPQQQPPPGNGWHGTQARQGWFGDREYDTDPRTNMPKAPTRGWVKKTSAKQALKKWAKGKTKAQIKGAKKEIKKFRKDHETARHRQKRLEHDRELRRTRKERMERRDLHQRTDRMMADRKADAKQEHTGPRKVIMPCKWCPVDVELRGSTWVHVDGQPCRSHDT